MFWSLLVICRRVHIGGKPCRCLDCGKCVAQLPHFIAHWRMHIGEKPYQCPERGKWLRQPQHLVIHLKFHSGGQQKRTKPPKSHTAQHLKMGRSSPKSRKAHGRRKGRKTV
ncbi:Zinc finger protein 22 [Varanus komodoensis]|nr:Zinc finger protein 22 [Varanus komodoensis]